MAGDVVAHGLMFHHFHGGQHRPDGHGSLSAADFESALVGVGIDNIRSPQEWLHGLMLGRLSDTDVCITFDDALRSQLDVCLPVLERYDLQAFWFIYSAPFEGAHPPLDLFRRFRYQFYEHIDGYYADFWVAAGIDVAVRFGSLEYADFSATYAKQYPFYSANDIRYRYVRDRVLGPERYHAVVSDLMRSKQASVAELCDGLWLKDEHLRLLYSQGHVIGLHSYDHPTNLASLNARDQREQYVRNYEHITRVCERPTTMSHPCNSYNDATLEILRELGVVCGFRSNMCSPPGKLLNASSLELARVDSAMLRNPVG